MDVGFLRQLRAYELPCEKRRTSFPSPPSLGVPDGGEGGRGRVWLRPWREGIGAARDFPERPLSDRERLYVLDVLGKR